MGSGNWIFIAIGMFVDNLSSMDMFMSKIDSQLKDSNKVMFTVQSGEPWTLSENDIFAGFSIFGKIHRVHVSATKSVGRVIFFTVSEARKSWNTVIEIKGCLIHASRAFCDLSPFPVPHQILIESERLPIKWEKFVIIKNFFENFGEVRGINLKGNRLVVSFKDDIAASLTGSLIKVPWDTDAVFVREVSCLTVQ